MIEAFSDLIPYYSFLYILIAVVVIWSAKKYRKVEGIFLSVREKRFSLFYGSLFVLFYALGLVLASGGSIHWKSALFVFAAWLLFSAAVGIGYHYLNAFLAKVCSPVGGAEYALAKYPMLLSISIMMVCWMPVFLALYPGVFAYDVQVQIPQAVSGYNTFHPLLHTFYLVFFHRLGGMIGSYNMGIAISVLIQMVIFASSLAYTIRYLVEKRIKKSIILAVLACFSLIPFFPVMAVSVTKDIFFTAAFHVAFIKLLKLRDSGYDFQKWRDWIHLIFFFVLTALLRNNGRYAIYVVVIALLLQAIVNHSNIKKMCALVLVTIMSMTVCSNALRIAVHAGGGSRNEVMSVPYQQIARVYKYDADLVSEKDKVSIKNIIPEVEKYNESVSDPIKGSATAISNSENRKCFLRIYFKYMLLTPNRYTEAFLINTMGYWFVDDISSSLVYKGLPAAGIFEVISFEFKEFGVTHESKLPALDNVLVKLFHENKYQDLPIVAAIFNMGVYLWLILMCAFFCMQKKKGEMVIPLAFLFAYMSTVFAGPCALFRYALPYITCIPALLIAVYQPSYVKKAEDER